MSVNFGASLIQVSSTWTAFKATAITSKKLSVQYDDDGVTYTIWAMDQTVLYLTTIWKGTVPDGVIASGYSQATNDTDKSDFTTNYQSSANQRLALSVGGIERSTYVAESALAGANNKNMMTLLNPSGSGKIIKLFQVWAVVPSSSGTTVIIPFEMRRCSAHTGGTDVTPQKYDTSDGSAVTEVKAAPATVTDVVLLYTWLVQINTSQGSTDAMVHLVRESSSTSNTKALVLRPGEGICLKQVANNTSTFRMGALWTEE